MRRKVFIYFLSALLLFAIFGGIQKITSFQYSPLGALIAGFFPSWQKNQPPIPPEEVPESSFVQEENTNPGAGQDQDLLVEKIDDLEDQIDVLSKRINEMEKQLQLLNKQVLMTQEEEEDTEEESEEDELIEEEVGQEVGQEPCERIQWLQPAKNKIILNEIAWMGTSASSSAEWMELKNIFGESLNLSGWQILSKENKIKIIFSGKNAIGATYGISAGGFLLLERTSDEAIPGVSADLIYSGVLRNSDEALYLFDENCQLQDEVIAGPDWPAGDNSSKRTMERKSDFAWQTSLSPGGTPKAENSSGYVVVIPGGGGGGGAPPEAQPKITLSYSEDNPVNKEIEAALSLADLKNVLYDVKVSIENEGIVLSEIYNQKENKWQLSLYYLKEVFSGDSFEGKFQLRIKEEMKDFRGQADIVAKIRQNDNEKIVSEFKGKINITDPEQEPNQPPIASFTFSPRAPFVGDLIDFDASSSTDDGQIINYIWDFGDDSSTTINQATTTHSYATSTDFTIGLQIVDNEEAISALATSTIFVAETGAPFSELDVVINEIAWMGTAASSTDEWIELYNNSEKEISVSGWEIENAGAANKSLDIVTTKKISAKSFFVICKRELDFCDLTISRLSLNNDYKENGKLVLREKAGDLIDQTPEADKKEWPAGNKDTKQTMERINPLLTGNNSANWQNSQNAGGTPKTQNSVYQQP